MTFRRTVFVFILLLVIVGCSSVNNAQPPTAVPTKVSLQLSWSYDYSSAGFYAAAKNGHYAEQNIDVTIASGGFVDGHYVDPVQAVTNGTNDFSEADAQSLLQTLATTSKPVVAVASVQQRGADAVITLANKQILKPKDLIGKTVAANEGGATQLFEAMLKSQGIDPSQVNIVPRTDFGVDPLVKGQVDALIGWVINEGVLVREAGLQPSFMLLSDYGIPSYNVLIVTTQEMVQNHPDVVERFLRASFAGWQDIINSPQQGAEYTLAYNKDLKLDQQLNRLQVTIPLIQPARSRIGMMDPNTWEQIETVMLNAGVLKQQVDVTKVYTMQFLNKIYPQ
jgi:NitT/TauT family transport system substrate-binding protein